MSRHSNANSRKVLVQTDAFELVSILWTEQSATDFHDHKWSRCHVFVEEGVFENTIDLGAKKETQTFCAGQSFSTLVGARHKTVCKTASGKTLHFYTPKIQSEESSLKFDSVNLDEIKNKISLSDPSSLTELSSIMEHLKQQSISTASPYFMNQLFSGVLPQMLIAEEFIAQTKTTLATYESGSVLSAVENEVVESLCEIIGWSKNSNQGVAVPGGSAANFMALHCARDMLFPNANQLGTNGKVLKVFVSSQAHYSFKKACAVLGIGISNLIAVPADASGKMQPQALDDLIQKAKSEGAIPLMVAATAGTTVLGAFDDLSQLASVCKKHSTWLHVDGAWGGPALFSKKIRHLFAGVELADSVTFDAHKLFGASLTTSFFLTKHQDSLLHANDVSGGDYIFHSEETIDRGRLSWQCGRGGDAMSFWAIWKSLGSIGLGDVVDRQLGIRDEILPWIESQDRLELISSPEYLNICVRVLAPNKTSDPEWSKKVRERLKEKNLALVNYASNTQGSFLRLILAHPHLTVSHVKQVLDWALEEN